MESPMVEKEEIPTAEETMMEVIDEEEMETDQEEISEVAVAAVAETWEVMTRLRN